MGRVVIVGASLEKFSIDAFRLVKGEIVITGFYTSLKSDFPALIDLVSKKKNDVREIIKQVVILDEINRGIEIMRRKIGNPVSAAVKV